MKKTVIFVALMLSLTTMASIKKAAPGANLKKIIPSLEMSDTLMVASGEYDVAGNFLVTKNIVIIGEGETKPNISFANFVVRTGAERLVFQNLNITINKKYLVSSEVDSEMEIGLIAVKDCIVNFGGEGGACLVQSGPTNETRNKIGEILVENSIFYNGGFPLHFIYSSTTISKTIIEKITLLNSTFVDMGRGVVATNVACPDVELTVRNCTFYNINRSANDAGTFRLGTSKVNTTIENSIFSFGSDKTKFIITGQGSKTKVSNSFTTNELPSVTRGYGIKRLDKSAQEIFAAPSDNPTDGKASFRITDGALNNVGDPRW